MIPQQLSRRRGLGHRLRNVLQTVLFIGAMSLLLGLCGWIVAGPNGLVIAGLFSALSLFLGLRSPTELVLRLIGARPLPRQGFEELRRRIAGLARRAGLPAAPRLYFVPSPQLNAFTLGDREAAAITVTSGLIQRLAPRELLAVLAHELSHIRHGDIRIMTLASVIARMSRSLSLLGLVLLLANVPLLLAEAGGVPWLLVLILIAAPLVESLLHLALARAREFDADLDAAVLTGDPLALAAALAKVERHEARLWRRLLPSYGARRTPSVLQTHPATAERIKRLIALEAEGDAGGGASAAP